jgi:hypothetical protein
MTGKHFLRRVWLTGVVLMTQGTGWAGEDLWLPSIFSENMGLPGNLEPVPDADMTTTLQRPGVFENGAYSGHEGIGQNSPPPPGGSS